MYVMIIRHTNQVLILFRPLCTGQPSTAMKMWLN